MQYWISYQITHYPKDQSRRKVHYCGNIPRIEDAIAPMFARITKVSNRALPEKFTSHKKVADTARYREIKRAVLQHKSSQSDHATRGFVRLTATRDHLINETLSASQLTEEPQSIRSYAVTDKEVKNALSNIMETITENKLDHKVEGWGYKTKSYGGEGQKTKRYRRPESPESGAVKVCKQYKYETEAQKCLCPKNCPSLFSYALKAYAPKAKGEPMGIKFSERYDVLAADGKPTRLAEKNIFFSVPKQEFKALIPTRSMKQGSK